MGLLDQVLANTSPHVVSARHNTADINWVAGLSDPGEMIRCGYLPEIRRQAGEQDEAYAERIRPIVMSLPLGEREKIMNAAIRRASLDTSTGKVAVMVAGKPAWHNLGTNVSSAFTKDDVYRLAPEIMFTVSKIDTWYKNPVTGEDTANPDVFSICRMDTGAKLGTVGSKYKPIQNSEAFDFMDEVIGEYGARYEVAGSIFGGEKVWLLVHLPQQAFTVGHTDRIEPYALFTNPHDGSGSAYCYPTSERVVCANTYRVAQRGKGKGIAIRHTGDVKARIVDAKEALGLAVKGFDRFHADADILSRTKLADPQGYFADVLDACLDMTEANAIMGADALAAALKVTDGIRELERKKLQRQIDARANILDDILDRYESERCGINGMRGTAWSGFNAVTEYADHSPLMKYKGSSETQQSRRLESTISGDGDEMKQVAFEYALAAAKA